MKREYHKWFSQNIGKEMEVLIHGHAGKPYMVFPCSNGRFFDFENRKMFETITDLIDNGEAIFFSVDSLDWETWHNYDQHPSVGAARHKDYDNYIVHEVVPFINNYLGKNQQIIATGASMGAYHSINFFLRHPDIFDGTLALSGNYHIKHFFGEYMDENVYLNSPTAYLPNNNDEWFLEKYRNSKIMVCVGQGDWEDTMVADTLELKAIFEQKQINATIEFWGHDVNHDWNWWEIQFPYFMKKLHNKI